MKEFRHLGVYGILIKNDKILLIKKGNVCRSRGEI